MVGISIDPRMPEVMTPKGQMDRADLKDVLVDLFRLFDRRADSAPIFPGLLTPSFDLERESNGRVDASVFDGVLLERPVLSILVCPFLPFDMEDPCGVFVEWDRSDLCINEEHTLPFIMDHRIVTRIEIRSIPALAVIELELLIEEDLNLTIPHLKVLDRDAPEEDVFLVEERILESETDLECRMVKDDLSRPSNIDTASDGPLPAVGPGELAFDEKTDVVCEFSGNMVLEPHIWVIEITHPPELIKKDECVPVAIREGAGHSDLYLPWLTLKRTTPFVFDGDLSYGLNLHFDRRRRVD